MRIRHLALPLALFVTSVGFMGCDDDDDDDGVSIEGEAEDEDGEGEVDVDINGSLEFDGGL